MKLEIPIKTNEENIFYLWAKILGNFHPLNKLAEKDLKVYSEILKYFYKYKNTKEDLRWKMIFDYDTKLSMQENLGLSYASFSNSLTKLRKHGIIINGRVKEALLFKPDKDNVITFKFSL